MEIDNPTFEFLQSAVALAKVMKTIDTSDEVSDEVGEQAIHIFLDAYGKMQDGQGHSDASGVDTADG